MKLKVDKTSLIKYGIYLIFLLDICFWYIVPIETSFTGMYNKKLITLLIVGLTLIILVTTKIFWKKSFGFLLMFFLLYLTDVIALFIYSKSQYPAQGFGGTFAMAYYYLGLLIVFPILYVMMKSEAPEQLIEMLNKFAIILIALLLLQGIVYSLSGKVFLSELLNADDLMMRNGRIRIGMTLMGNISVIYNFSNIVDKKAEKIHYAGFVMGLICVFLVQMTRMYELAIVGALVAIFITSSERNNKILRIFIVSIIAIYIIFGTGIINSFISSFDVNGDLGAGTRVRIEAIEYFMSFVRKSPFFGMGFVHQNYYSKVLYGTTGTYYLSDVGIIGLLTECGWGMTFLYIVFCIRMIYIIIKLREQRSSFLVGILTFTLLCTPTLVIWGRRSIIYVGLIMAIFEHSFHKYIVDKRR